jgi:hypothetical protein
MRNLILTAIVLALASGCATNELPVPAGYTGPTATIGEHGFAEDRMKGQLFYIEAIDGKPVESSLQATRHATSNLGLSLAIRSVDHTVPIKPLKLKLVGTHITGAPIHEIASRAAGTFFRVEGEITFTPVEGGSYFVTGKLQKEGSAAWVADAKTEQRVSEMVLEKK